jgi:aerobic-type carbon monoxide dehydrogenase small subunit (CoxS/CutS family)
MPDQSQTTNRGSGYNRRDFLKGSGAAVAATAIAAQATEEVQAQGKGKPNVVSSDATEVKLTVNGKDHVLTLEPRAVLLDVLRNDLNLTGCKDVDDRTASGADTVMIDGKAVLASSRLAIQCVGQQIHTVESLSKGADVDEVITGFVKHDAMQCGFCTPGFVMATRAFLNKNPKASLEEIRKGLGGNICRCGTYHGITKCALEIAKKGGA